MNWFSAEHIIHVLDVWAVYGVAAIIFLETATILGSFLPGDSLLFILGLSLATTITDVPIWLALPLLAVSAIGGSQVGFTVGKKIGPPLFTRTNTWFFNQGTVEQTRILYSRYGTRAIILARFVPVLRAIVPMFAGIAEMPRRLFFKYNIIGGLLWSVGVTLAGYLLGQVPYVRANFEWFVLGFVIASSLPFPIELIRHRLQVKRTK
ncbi:MAG: VTT domain-containing protein [Micrococcales bacterium]